MVAHTVDLMGVALLRLGNAGAVRERRAAMGGEPVHSDDLGGESVHSDDLHTVATLDPARGDAGLLVVGPGGGRLM